MPSERLRAEARLFAKRQFDTQAAAAARPEQLRSTIFALTGALPPEDLASLPRETLSALSDTLKRALARERGKARSGHRSYDTNRHIALHQALRGLNELLARARQGPAGERKKAG